MSSLRCVLLSTVNLVLTAVLLYFLISGVWELRVR